MGGWGKEEVIKRVCKPTIVRMICVVATPPC